MEHLRKRDKYVRRNIGIRIIRFGLILYLYNPIVLEIIFTPILRIIYKDYVHELDNLVLNWHI